jgi:hypothetical protein
MGTEAGWETNGIAFEDYARMNQRNSGVTAGRHNPVPEWANANAKLLEVVVLYCEHRVGIYMPAQGATLRQRMAHAEERMRAQLPQMGAVLTRLCHEYVAVKNSQHPNRARLKELQEKIENIDTAMRMCKRGMGAVALACAVHYYRNNMNSVQCAAQIGIKPPHVRTILLRLDRSYQRTQEPNYRTNCVLKSLNSHQHRNAVEKLECRLNRAACVAMAAATPHLVVPRGTSVQPGMKFGLLTVPKPGPRLRGRRPAVVVNPHKIIKLYTQGVPLAHIAVDCGYPRGKGSNRCRSILIKAKLWKPAYSHKVT